MRALALLGPYSTADDLQRFRQEGVELFRDGARLPDADAVLILGGDGTVHRYLPELVRARVPLLAVPMGSGNDFHRALGLATVDAALAAWRAFCARRGNVREIDLGLIRPQQGDEVPYCCVAGVGMDSDANRRANRMPQWLRARGGYVLAAALAALRFRPQTMTVSGSRALSEPAMFVAFANAPAYGGGMRIAPAAQMDDGRLDVCFVRRVGAFQLLRFLPTVFTGAHVRFREIEYFQADRLRVETETPLDVYADGDLVCRTPVDVHIAPRALRVIVPA